MTKTDLQNKMDEKKYAPSFKLLLLDAWAAAETAGLPSVYYADVGSFVINDIHIDNGVGDGVFRIKVIHSTDNDFAEVTALYKQTGVFFYSNCVTIRLYDMLPESAFTCNFGDMAFAEVLKNNDGNILIAVHNKSF